MSFLQRRVARLERQLAAREFHFAELERRLANVVRVGTIQAVENGKVRVRIGTDPEGKPVLTPWLPWTERAGRIKTWMPPSAGEQVRVISPSGDVAQGWIDCGGFSDANPAPSDDAAEHVETIGDVRLIVRNGEFTVVQGGASISLKGGEVRINGQTVSVDGKIELTGAELTHNGTNISDSHVHTNVMPGPALTGPPQE